MSFGEDMVERKIIEVGVLVLVVLRRCCLESVHLESILAPHLYNFKILKLRQSSKTVK